MRFLFAIAAFFSLVPALAETVSKVRPQPNILLIMLDDAGYNDVAGFGSEFNQSLDNEIAPTPNLQKLASEGTRFTRFYADSTCRPARLSLLTGKQAARVATLPDFRGISPEVITLPEQLQQSGYSTHHIGKWHLGDTTPLAAPQAQGFDSWLGFLNQFLLRGPDANGEPVYKRPTYFNPWLQGYKNNQALPLKQYNGHLTDILAAATIDKINGLKQQSQPWFINYWMLAPHNPARPSAEYAKQFSDTKAGSYHALLKQADDAIGRILDALEESGQIDNTVVIVLSDNGGTNERTDNNFPYQGVKGTFTEGGTRTPMIFWNKHYFPVGETYDGIAAIYDIYPTLLNLSQNNIGKNNNIPPDLDGVDLTPLLDKNIPRPKQTLFWEHGGLLVYHYSVLSKEGDWRLQDESLFNLAKQPFGNEIAKTDSWFFGGRYEKNAQEKQQQKQLFLQWRKEIHPLNVETVKSPRGIDAQYKITGDSLRRSPGFGGFTLAASVSPLADGGMLTGTLASQAGMWDMAFTDDQRIRVTINNESVLSEVLPVKRCNTLVLTTHYQRSKLHRSVNNAVWFLYWNGEEVAEKYIDKPSLLPEQFMQPTYLGGRADGQSKLNAKITAPVLYNELFFRNDPWDVERDPYRLSQSYCLPN